MCYSYNVQNKWERNVIFMDTNKKVVFFHTIQLFIFPKLYILP